jgi:hypothetical protein
MEMLRCRGSDSDDHLKHIDKGNRRLGAKELPKHSTSSATNQLLTHGKGTRNTREG